MSAQEIIEKIKTLPENERLEVAAYLQTLKDGRNGSAAEGERPNIGALTEQVFNDYDNLFRKLAQ